MNIEFENEQEKEDFKKMKLISIEGVEFLRKDIAKGLVINRDEVVKKEKDLAYDKGYNFP